MRAREASPMGRTVLTNKSFTAELRVPYGLPALNGAGRFSR